jgi:peptidoglycan/xylan/chitin deacetylase (PgdA/CDA1 family)
MFEGVCLMLARRTFFTGIGAMTVGVMSAPITTGAAGPRGMIWPGGQRAAVSLTYDDGLDSQLENVAPQLDEFGLKATFFLTRENMEERVADWVALARRGHEIADHTNTHPCKLQHFTSQTFERDEIAPAEQFFDDNFGPAHPRTYAYPCGFTRLGRGDLEARWSNYLSVLRPNFLAARTVGGGPNDPRHVAANRYQLNAFEPTYDYDDPRTAMAYVGKAIARGQWAILVFHEVLDRRVGAGDTSKAVHHQIVQWLTRQPVWCAPMGEVFHQIVQA